MVNTNFSANGLFIEIMFGIIKKRNKRKYIRCISDLRKIDHREMHFNIYRTNGEVLCQMVRYKFVKEWGYNLNLDYQDCFVLLLQFFPEKENNDKNHKKLIFSKFFKNFVLLESLEISSYAYPFSMDMSDEMVVDGLVEIITTVYGDVNKIKYEVRGFN